MAQKKYFLLVVDLTSPIYHDAVTDGFALSMAFTGVVKIMIHKGKLVGVAVMTLVLCVSVIGVGIAGPFGPVDNPGAFCNDNDDFGVGHDTCVTCLNKGQGNAANCICKLFADIGFKNHGQCVKALKANGL